jgi:hypothetical protein
LSANFTLLITVTATQAAAAASLFRLRAIPPVEEARSADKVDLVARVKAVTAAAAAK